MAAGRNPALALAVAVSAALSLVTLAVPPVAERVGVVGLSPAQLAAVVGLALLTFLGAEAQKVWRRW